VNRTVTAIMRNLNIFQTCNMQDTRANLAQSGYIVTKYWKKSDNKGLILNYVGSHQ